MRSTAISSGCRGRAPVGSDVDATDIAVTVKMASSRWPGLLAATAISSRRRRRQTSGRRRRRSHDIEVRLPSLDQRPDPESPGTRSRRSSTNYRLSRAAQGAGAQRMDHPRRRSRMGFPVVGAERAVRRIKGIKGVTNSIR